MPQSSLLSYFSKPVTAAVPAQAPSARDDQALSEHGSAVRAPSKRGQNIEKVVTPKRVSQDAAQSVQSQQERSKPEPQIPLATHLDERQEARSPAGTPPIHTSIPPTHVAVRNLTAATISPVLEQHLSAIRRLTSTTLPVRYSEAFFKDAVTDPTAQYLSRVALYESEPVGWIRCRLEPCSPNTAAIPLPSQVYIQALAVLPPFRNLGLAMALLDDILSAATSLEGQPVCLYAHVWEKNEEALEWYTKRGFKRVMLLERYYLRLRPSGAWIVRRELVDQ
jgi:N-alpha-acetyltransferase 50